RTLQLSAPEPLAVHAYRLFARLGEQEFLYAQITEFHHPAFLTPDQLKGIYGSFSNDEALNTAITGLADTSAHQGLQACA
ncbi:MAG: hypothetical protein AAF385_17690, partial [Pseudomonadota bacterium]